MRLLCQLTAPARQSDADVHVRRAQLARNRTGNRQPPATAPPSTRRGHPSTGTTVAHAAGLPLRPLRWSLPPPPPPHFSSLSFCFSTYFEITSSMYPLGARPAFFCPPASPSACNSA
eukprot:14694406-Alexandrium_andersonii.AAC.1